MSADYDKCPAKIRIDGLEDDIAVIHKRIDSDRKIYREDRLMLQDSIIKLGEKLDTHNKDQQAYNEEQRKARTKVLAWITISALSIIGGLIVYIWVNTIGA